MVRHVRHARRRGRVRAARLARRDGAARGAGDAAETGGGGGAEQGRDRGGGAAQGAGHRGPDAGPLSVPPPPPASAAYPDFLGPECVAALSLFLVHQFRASLHSCSAGHVSLVVRRARHARRLVWRIVCARRCLTRIPALRLSPWHP